MGLPKDEEIKTAGGLSMFRGPMHFNLFDEDSPVEGLLPPVNLPPMMGDAPQTPAPVLDIDYPLLDKVALGKNPAPMVNSRVMVPVQNSVDRARVNFIMNHNDNILKLMQHCNTEWKDAFRLEYDGQRCDPLTEIHQIPLSPEKEMVAIRETPKCEKPKPKKAPPKLPGDPEELERKAQEIYAATIRNSYTSYPKVTRTAPVRNDAGSDCKEKSPVPTRDPVPSTEKSPVPSREKSPVPSRENSPVYSRSEEKALRDSPSTEKTPASPSTEKIPSSPSTEKTPASPSTEKTPAFPSTEKTPAFPSTEETPASPSTEKTPASPSTEKTPASPSTEKIPSSPSTEKTPASPSTEVPSERFEADNKDGDALNELPNPSLVDLIVLGFLRVLDKPSVDSYDTLLKFIPPHLRSDVKKFRDRLDKAPSCPVPPLNKPNNAGSSNAGSSKAPNYSSRNPIDTKLNKTKEPEILSPGIGIPKTVLPSKCPAKAANTDPEVQPKSELEDFMDSML